MVKRGATRLLFAQFRGLSPINSIFLDKRIPSALVAAAGPLRLSSGNAELLQTEGGRE